MSHVFRFFGESIDSNRWRIAASEIEHARKVLKLKSGDTVEVTDGAGHVAQGVVDVATRDDITINVNAVRFFPAQEVRRCIALGALKPGDIDDILAELVELAVDEVHVFQQGDTAKYRTGDKPRERWERVVRSAVKQSKRAWLPQIFVHENYQDALMAGRHCEAKWVLDAEATTPILKAAQQPIQSVFALVGGERGLTPKELQLALEAGFHPVKLGPYVLRARTAGVAAAAVLSMLVGRN